MEHNDAQWKTIHEVIYYIPDHRPTAPTALVAEGFILDAEAGDQIVSIDGGDVLSFHEKRKDLPAIQVTVTIPLGGYLYRMDRVYLRKRRDDEPVPLVEATLQQ